MEAYECTLCFMATTIDAPSNLETYLPPYNQWSQLLASNVSRRGTLFKSLGEEHCRRIRSELCIVTAEYTESLFQLAKAVGIAVSNNAKSVAQSPDEAIIMAGHQPVVYHPGVLFKPLAQKKLAEESGGTAINVVIDTDSGDSGALQWPQINADTVCIAKGSLTNERDTLYRSQNIIDEGALRVLGEAIQNDLNDLGCNDEANRAKTTIELYTRLAGHSAMKAHTLVRWAHLGYCVPEIPLSILFECPSIQEIVESVLERPVEWARCYNETLDHYRERHKIANRANPFPNVAAREAGQELPLWIVRGKERVPYVAPRDGMQKREEGLLVSRGSVTTLILRAFCSDIFIHGLGGGKYDQFVDELAQSILGIELPCFVVASTTRYLSPRRVECARSQVELVGQRKEIVSRPTRYFDSGVFAPAERDAVATLEEQREQLRSSIKASEGAEEKRATLLKLNELNSAIQTIVLEGRLGELLENIDRLQNELKVWENREYPFFLFE